MSEINTNKIVGDTFEDMSIAEMALVQGSGDVNPETLISLSAALTAAAVTWEFSVNVTKTIKGTC